MTDKADYIIHIDNELYTIKIHKREEGYYPCIYRIVSDEEHSLMESSGRKILHRLTNAFKSYMDELGTDEIYKIKNDLEIISKALNIPCDYLETLGLNE